MARVPPELVRRGIVTGPQKTPHAATQQTLLDMRRRLHLQLRDMTEEDIRRVSMATFDSMMMQLWREGHIWSGRMLTEFIELDKLARRICMMVAPYLRRPALRTERKLLRMLADQLCAAEDAMNDGNAAEQAAHLLFLAQETARRGLSWWWLTERLLKEATAAAYSEGGEVASYVALAKGAFLLNQLHESGEAVDALTEAMTLSQNQEWLAYEHLTMEKKLDADAPLDDRDDSLTQMRVKTPPDVVPGQELTVFQVACALLSRALLQEARRARRGCGFGAKKAPPPTLTQAREPNKFPQRGNPFQDQVDECTSNCSLRTPRVLSQVATETAEPVTRESGDKAQDLARMLREDMDEPDVENRGKVDPDTGAAFCYEAIRHAEEAERRDLEERGRFELGVCLLAADKNTEALQSFDTVLEMYVEDDNNIQVIKTHFQIALCYQRMTKTSEAHAELQKGLLHAQETKNRWFVFAAHKYIGMFFLNSNQRQYATTHLALAVLQTRNAAVPLEEQALVRVLTGVAAAAELMPAYTELLRSTAPHEPGCHNSFDSLMKWQDLRTPFWPDQFRVSQAVRDLQTFAPVVDQVDIIGGHRQQQEEQGGERGSEQDDEIKALTTEMAEATSIKHADEEEFGFRLSTDDGDQEELNDLDGDDFQ